MLAVNSQIHEPQQLPQNSMAHSVNETQNDGQILIKQQSKKKLITPLNVLIILSLLFLISLGSYYILNLNAKQEKSGLTQSHEKIIQNSESGSSKKEGSSSGSSSSKSSTGNSKPNAKSGTVNKHVISSNPSLTGSGGNDPNGDDNNGDDDKKKKKEEGTDGTTNDVDSDQEEDESEEEDNGQFAQIDEKGKIWEDTRLEGTNAPPLVGNARP